MGDDERASWISEAPLWAGALEHVLVIAERFAQRTELSQLCTSEGYQVSSLAKPELLLSRPSVDVDLILMVLEPHGESPRLCGEVRALETLRSVSILLLTAEPPAPEQAALALSCGADDYCSFDARWTPELSARIRLHLRNKRTRDAVERLRGERNKLRTRARKDSLTGALNRSALSERVDKALQRNAAFALLFADIDHFKQVNDTLGHQIGDLTLQRVAETLVSMHRPGDVCGRYGGEEFVMVLEPASAPQAQRLAEQYRTAVAALSLAREGGPERVTISIGVAAFDPALPDPSAATLLSRADAALYRAKRAGRNRVVLAEPYSPADTFHARRAERFQF